MRKLKQFMIPLLALFIALVSDVTTLLQMMKLHNGRLWLLGLFVVALAYMVSEEVWWGWQRSRASQSKLGEMRDLVLSAGNGDIIRECALIRRIYEQGQAIRIRSILSVDLVVIDVSRLALREDDDLKGTKWALISQNGGGQIQGEVIDYDGKEAHVRLSQPSTVTPQKGDLAMVIEPAHATDVERLAAKMLCLIGQ